jgi:hypothetical protein
MLTSPQFQPWCRCLRFSRYAREVISVFVHSSFTARWARVQNISRNDEVDKKPVAECLRDEPGALPMGEMEGHIIELNASTV